MRGATAISAGGRYALVRDGRRRASLFRRADKRGAEIFERNCAPCHGPRMQDPESAFDLRKFPRDQYDRFVNSVTRGKNQMPPWGDMLKPEEIEALWAYVTTGER